MTENEARKDDQVNVVGTIASEKKKRGGGGRTRTQVLMASTPLRLSMLLTFMCHFQLFFTRAGRILPPPSFAG